MILERILEWAIGILAPRPQRKTHMETLRCSASRRGNRDSGIRTMGADKGYDQKEFVIGSQ